MTLHILKGVIHAYENYSYILYRGAALFDMTVNTRTDAINVILMISDGAEYNTFYTTNYQTLVQDKVDFEALTSIPTPDKMVCVPQNSSTLLTNFPTLHTITSAALKVLNNSLNGFAVMIEGGAVAWANHANQLDQMTEEQIDFNNSDQEVYDWVMNFSSWDEALLIVTADHETGYQIGDGTSGVVDLNGNGVYDAGVDYSQIADKGVCVLLANHIISATRTRWNATASTTRGGVTTSTPPRSSRSWTMHHPHRCPIRPPCCSLARIWPVSPVSPEEGNTGLSHHSPGHHHSGSAPFSLEIRNICQEAGAMPVRSTLPLATPAPASPAPA